MTRIDWLRAVAGGLLATAVMTGVSFLARAMGFPPMNVAAMLASAMGGSLLLGWLAHFMIGTGLAVIYAGFFTTRLPGPGFARGALYGLVPWIVAQLVVMPMMGPGLFGGSAGAALRSLVSHLVYGAVLGAVYGTVRAEAARPAHAQA